MASAQSTSKCEFCGRELESIVVECLGRTHRTGAYVACGCPEAKEKAAREAAEERERVAKTEAQRRIAAYRKAGIYEEFLDAESSPESRKIAEAMVGGSGAVVHGPSGVGKSGAASAAAIWLLDHSKGRVAFQNAADFVMAVRSRIDDVPQIVNRLGSVAFLFLDDLGAENTTPAALEALYAVIDKRERAMLPTCITSNYSMAELFDRIAKRSDEATADRLMSRIRHRAIVIPMQGEDRRV